MTPSTRTLFVLLTLFTLSMSTACDKPEVVTAKLDEVCHPSEEYGWKRCDANLYCTTESEIKYHPKEPTKLEEATVTTITGSSGDGSMDCFGFMGSKCTAKGKCIAGNAKLGEWCVADEMCTEGSCLGNVDDQGRISWSCSKK